VQGIIVEQRGSDFFGTAMRATLKTYAVSVYVLVLIFSLVSLANAQAPIADASSTTCAAILADSTIGVRLTGPPSDSVRNPDAATRLRSDTASFGVGRARGGAADIILRVGVHADEVRFAKQPNVRVRLCWGGDTLRVLQRENLPSPVVAGTTYRNVYVAVELVGRLNAECLANVLGVGNNPQAAPRQPSTAVAAASTENSLGGCAFLGGSAGTGAQSARPPTP
jgi:hypothetical protein